MGGGLCCACYQRKRRSEYRDNGPRVYFKPDPTNWTFESGGKPPRITGIEQHAVTSVPDVCPKCHHAALDVQGREIWCRGVLGGCGATLYIVREDSLDVHDALTRPRAGGSIV